MKSSRADFSQQQKKAGSRIVPTAAIPVLETNKDDRVKVSWRTSAETRRELKQIALDRDCTVNDLLDEAAEWIMSRGADPVEDDPVEDDPVEDDPEGDDPEGDDPVEDDPEGENADV